MAARPAAAKKKKPSPGGKAFSFGPLLAWYDRHRRDLPWRRTSDPYKILVSELMLQQTQVATVIPYYRRFLRLFPSASALAAAPEAAVLKAWEGLGYYRRARFLQAAARQVARGGAGFPADIEGLRALPGVGDYTAAAVGSIALGLPAAVVDGNVVRVLTRRFALEGDPAREPLKSKIKALAQAVLDRARPGDFNQAMMELGATVCRPDAPHCAACPLEKSCLARRAGRELDFPQTAPRPATKKVFKVAALVLKKGGPFRLWMAPRVGSGRGGDEGRLEGLWQFPEKVVKDAKKAAAAALALARRTAPGAVPVAQLEPVVHQVTHHRITVQGFVFEAAGAAPGWVALKEAELARLPLAKAERLLLTRLRAR